MFSSIVEGNGIRFSDLECGQKPEHRILIAEADLRKVSELKTLVSPQGMTLTRCWNVSQTRMDTVRQTIEQNVRRLGASLVGFVIDIVEERAKDSVGLTHRTLVDTFPDGTIAGVPYVAVGYDYPKKDPTAKASWANQLNTGLAFARLVGVKRLIPLTTEVEVLHDLPHGPADGVISCRLDRSTVFNRSDTESRVRFQDALDALIKYVVCNIAIGSEHLPYLAMMQRNTLRVIDLEALEMTNGWDPSCDARGGMEDLLHWLSYLIQKERLQAGWYRKCLPLVPDERWLFYTEARNGKSPYESDPDKLGRELAALRHVFDDLNACRLVVPRDRSFFI